MLPRFGYFRRSLQTLPSLDPEKALRQEWRKLSQDSAGAASPPELGSLHGKRVALGIGSRGIQNLVLLTRTLVALLREAGAEPFIVPAMGSHGGATAAGQLEVLRDLGITEATAGCPLRATMETVVLGHTAEGLPVHLDTFAADADGIMILNRIKPHTSFTGELESGLHKMLAIGLGKEKAASLLHAGGSRSLREDMPKVARVLLEKSRFLAGFGIVEDAAQNLVALRGLGKRGMEAGEKELLTLARSLMPSLPLPEWDVLVVDEMGKDISGTGMDTHVIGRLRLRGEPEPVTPRIGALAVLRLTAASHGNALGIGLADFTTAEMLGALDFEKTRRNVLTTGNIERGRIPIVCADAAEAVREALHFALRSPEKPDARGPQDAGILRIRNTLRLQEFFVSEGRCEAVQAVPGIGKMGGLCDLNFIPEDWDAPPNL